MKKSEQRKQKQRERKKQKAKVRHKDYSLRKMANKLRAKLGWPDSPSPPSQKYKKSPKKLIKQ